MRIAVLGAGSWGTALAIAFAGQHAVSLWARDAAAVHDMSERRENRRYLAGCRFPAAMNVCADMKVALAGADLAILAAPKRVISTRPRVISAARALRPRPRPSQIPVAIAITFLTAAPTSSPI